MRARFVWLVCVWLGVGALGGCGEEENSGNGGATDATLEDTTQSDGTTSGDGTSTQEDGTTSEDGDTTTANDSQDMADEVEPPTILCDDSCQFNKNTVCDDDGPGATSDICPLGTDCTDCGPRDPDAVCGDGLKSPAEACDDGNLLTDDYCSPDCRTVTGSCGDGTKQPNEQCEDGNTVGDDGCSELCVFEIPCTLPDACPDLGNSICDPNTLSCAPIQCDAATGTGCPQGKTCQGQPLVVQGQPPVLLGACYTQCSPADPDACPEDMTCVVRPYQPDDQGVCVRAGDNAEGEACTSPPNHITSTGCEVGAVCDPPSQFPEEGVCTRQCALFGTTSNCEADQFCGITHACLDDSADAVTLAVGQPCGIAARNYTACAPNDVAYTGLCIGGTPTCQKVCQIGSVGARGCDDGDVCTRFRKDFDLGVCLKEPACGDGQQHPSEPCDGGTGCANCQPNYATLCAGAEVIPGVGLGEGTTAGGSSAFGHNACAVGPAPEKLYTFTPDTDGTVTVRVGSTENRDVAVYILEGCSGDAPIACADDFVGSLTESVSAQLTAGQTYTIVVDGALGESGAFVIEVLFD